jgi:hypothetical protein
VEFILENSCAAGHDGSQHSKSAQRPHSTALSCEAKAAQTPLLALDNNDNEDRTSLSNAARAAAARVIQRPRSNRS